MVRQEKSKILAIFMAFILILNTLTPMTTVFAEETTTKYNKDGIKDAELFDERDREEEDPTMYKGEIESVSEGAKENTIVFDLSSAYETEDLFLGFEHRLYLDSDEGVTILNKDDKIIDLKEGYTEYIEEANKPYKIKIKKDDEELIEYTVLVKTADYIPEAEIELEEVKNFEDETFEYGIKKEELKEKLPKELMLIFNDSTKREVPVEWDLTSFVVNQPGEFIFSGDYELPENIKGEKLPVDLKVIISEETVDTVDTAELEELIEIANEKSSQDYTEVSFKNLDTAIKTANEALGSNDETLIAEALNILQIAIDELVINNENYEFNIETGTITKYTGTKENVIIPEEINGVVVKEIGDLAFGEKNLAGKKLNKVTLPNTVEEIGERAFYRAHLTEVILSNNLTEISLEAFKHNNIEELIIPESVRSINKGAFESNKLKKVTLPNELTIIQANAFKDNNLTEVILPVGLTNIGTGAFASNDINVLNIPAKLQEIKGFANNELTEITLPNTITKIGKAAFASNNIESIEIPNSVTQIDELAFSNTGLTTLSVGNSVQEIGGKAFYDNNLKTVDLPKSIAYVKSQAFEKNKFTVGSVKIDNKRSEVSLGNKAFHPIEPIYLGDTEEKLGFKNFDIVTSKEDLLIKGEQKENVVHFNYTSSSETQELINNGETSFHIEVDEGTELFINNEIQEKNKVYYPVELKEENTFTLKKHGVEKEYRVNLNSIFINKEILEKDLTELNKLLESSLLTGKQEAEIIKLIEQAQVVNGEKGSTQEEIDEIIKEIEKALEEKALILEINIDGEITQYNGDKEELTIPGYWNEIQITQINSEVFANSNLKKVIIPETIKVIEEKAFANSKLEEVQFEINQLTQIMQEFDYFNLNKSKNLNELIIKQSAFKNNSLTEIYLPYYIKSIEDDAFADNNFKSFSVQIDNYKSEVNLGKNVFDGIYPTFLRKHINEVDKTYLSELIDQYQSIDPSQYTQSTYDQYKNAYKNAQIVLEKTTTEEEVSQAIEKLVQTNQALEISIELTQSDLKELLEIIKNLDTQDFDGDLDGLWRLINDIEKDLEKDLEQEDINGLYNELNTYYQGFSTPEKLFAYQILNKHEIAILEYRGVSSSIIIPSEIDGRKVTQITEGAFNEQNFSNILIPGTVYKIGNQAFANNNLKTIQLPESLNKLGTEVFKNNKLTKIKIPGRLEVIPNATFSGNPLIKEVYLSEGIKEVNDLAFAQSKINTINFPNSLEKIGDLAFAKNEITEVHLAENVIEIGASAFQDNKIEAGKATINNLKKNVKEEKQAFANNGKESNEEIKLIYNGTEETTIEVDSIENIEVEFNTNLNVVEEKLPQELELKINQLLQPGKVKTETVDVNWVSKTYDPKEIGTYTFVGMYELPEGITADKLEITVEVTVLAKKTDISELEAAIKLAEKVNNDSNATVEEVEEAINYLDEKLKPFKSDSESPGDSDDDSNGADQPGDSDEDSNGADDTGDSDDDSNGADQPGDSDDDSNGADQPGDSDDDSNGADQPGDSDEDSNGADDTGDSDDDSNGADQPGDSDEDSNGADQPGDSDEDSNGADQPSDSDEDSNGAVKPDDSDADSNGADQPGDSDADSNGADQPGDSDDDSNGENQPGDSDEDSNGADDTGDSDADSNGADQPGDSDADSNGADQPGDSDDDSNGENQPGDSDEDSNGADQPGDSDEDSNGADQPGDSDEDSNGADQPGDSDEDSNGADDTGDSDADSNGAVKPDDSDADSNGAVKPDDSDADSNGAVKPNDSDADSNGAVKPDDSDADSNGAVKPDDSDADSNGAVKPGDSDEDSNGAVKPDDSDADSNGAVKPDDSDEDSNGAVKPDDSDADSNGVVKPDDSDADSNGAVKPDDSDADSNGAVKPDDSDADSNGAVKPGGSDNGSNGGVLPNVLDNDSTKDGISDKKETAESKKDEKLPSSATNIFNLFALGIILIALGVLLVRRRKKVK